MDFLIDLLGRFHPLVVHLPIGFLLLGLMMLVFDYKERRHQKIIRFAFNMTVVISSMPYLKIIIISKFCSSKITKL